MEGKTSLLVTKRRTVVPSLLPSDCYGLFEEIVVEKGGYCWELDEEEGLRMK